MRDQCFTLFFGNAFLAIRRHVGWLLRFLAFQNRVQVLLIRQTRVEFLLGLLSVTNYTLAFLIVGRRVGVFGIGLVNGFFGISPAFFLGTMCIVHVSRAPEKIEKNSR